MDYQKHYDLLIAKRGNKEKPKDGGYYERHHILPRSLGGSDEEDNLTYLTGREHFMVHWLLYKIHGAGPMADAFYAMTMDRYGNRYAPNARLIEIAMKAKRDAHSDRYLNGEIVIKGDQGRLRGGGNSKNKEYKERCTGLTSSVSKFIWDFYKGETLVHTGTYSTFAKEFQFVYGGVYSSLKQKGSYKGYTYGNKRENPHRTKAALYDVYDYRSNSPLQSGINATQIWEDYSVLATTVKRIANREGQRQSKGLGFEHHKP
jgi:hypothetical protein